MTRPYEQDPLTAAVAAGIRARRTAAKWTCEQLARKMGVSTPLVVLIENGHRGITLPALARFAAAFRVQPRALLPPTAVPPCPVCRGQGRPGYTCNTCGISR